MTGLALAHRLLVLGGGRIGVTVLEAQSRPGGTAAACILDSSLGHRPAHLTLQPLGVWTGWVRSTFQDGVLMEEGPRSLRVPGNGATTLKLIDVS